MNKHTHHPEITLREEDKRPLAQDRVVIIPTSRKDFNEYQMLLSEALTKDGIDTEEVLARSDYKEFIHKYAIEKIIEKKHEYALQGISFTFAVTDIVKSSLIIGEAELQKQYSVINKWNGHFLVETLYFAKGPNDEIMVKTIPIKMRITKRV